ncbi:MAG: hypothetical protein DME22_14370 [Verrucomicrobia bacterium]|nr:MAG: hypothetical protein DME22_14370 [Verrucomicrobiota bacterium]
MQSAETVPLVAIACGGTGGHLFPGLAVAEVLARSGCALSLIISPKEVDQQAVKSAVGMEIVTLSAVGLVNGQIGAFLRGFWQSYLAAKQMFRARPPQAVLAMGGFTSAPPILAGRKADAATFLHESNSIPGRANRWLAPFVRAAFVGFPTAARRLRCLTVKVTGTPVRPQFHPMHASACRVALGLDGNRPVLLVVGGSQGARGVNQLVTRSLPLLAGQLSELQFLHLTGASDFDKVRDAYAAQKLKAVAMRVPAVLIPYPSAADNHQFYNAWAFVESGAARMLEQEKATPEILLGMVKGLIEKPEQSASMKEALARWHQPDAAEQIAGQMLEAMARNGVRVAPLLKQGEPPGARPVGPGRVEIQTARVA